MVALVTPLEPAEERLEVDRQIAEVRELMERFGGIAEHLQRIEKHLNRLKADITRIKSAEKAN